MPKCDYATVHIIYCYSVTDNWSTLGKNPVCDLYPITCSHPICISTGPLFCVNPIWYTLCYHQFLYQCWAAQEEGWSTQPRCLQPTTAEGLLLSTGTCSDLPSVTQTAAPPPFMQKHYKKVVHVVHITQCPGQQWLTSHCRSPPTLCQASTAVQEERESQNQLALTNFTSQIAYSVMCDLVYDSELCNFF